VTRAASGADLGTEVAGQLLTSPRVLWVVTGILGFLAIVPGLPFLPFVALAGVIGALAASGGMAPAMPVEPEATPGLGQGEPAPEGLLALDLMELEVGFELVPLVDGATGVVADGGGDLVERIRTVRRQLAQEMGFIVPPIHIRDNLQLPPSTYSILVKGIEVARGELPDREPARDQPRHRHDADHRRRDARAGVRSGRALDRARRSRARTARRLHRGRSGDGRGDASHRKSSAATRTSCSVARRCRASSTRSPSPAPRSSRSWCPSCSASAVSRRCSRTCSAKACPSATSRRSSKRSPITRRRRRTRIS
jgi:hypothetical protein